MFVHPHPDPVAFAVFGLPVRWYGLMYLAGFLLAWLLARRLIRRPAFAALSRADVENLFAYAVVGVVLGGRLGYVLFYNPAHFWQNPAEIFMAWQGGMSFHGGLLGVIVAMWFLGKRARFLRFADLAAILAPVGLGLGRLGNFINAELPGRAAAEGLPWAVDFGDGVARHPSPLYQFFVEGVLLGALMLFLARRPRPAGFLAGAFLSAYAAGRFFTEFFRQPDAHLGLFAGLSMGQILSLPMFVLGVWLVFRAVTVK